VLVESRHRSAEALALAWVEAVLRVNGCAQVGEELAWWAAELTVLRG
jgi:hypothetical protein